LRPAIGNEVYETQEKGATVTFRIISREDEVYDVLFYKNIL